MSGFAPTVSWQNVGHLADVFDKYLLNEKVCGWMDGWAGQGGPSERQNLAEKLNQMPLLFGI